MDEKWLGHSFTGAGGRAFAYCLSEKLFPTISIFTLQQMKSVMTAQWENE